MTQDEELDNYTLSRIEKTWEESKNFLEYLGILKHFSDERIVIKNPKDCFK